MEILHRNRATIIFRMLNATKPVFIVPNTLIVAEGYLVGIHKIFSVDDES